MLKILNISFNLLKDIIIFLIVFFITLIFLSIVSATIENAFAEEENKFYIKILDFISTNKKEIFLQDIIKTNLTNIPNVKITIAPLPNEKLTIKGEIIKDQILEKINTNNVKLIVPKYITIMSQANLLSKEKLKEYLYNELIKTDIWQKRLSNKENQLIIQDIYNFQDIIIPNRPINLKIRFIQNDNLLGLTNIEIEILDDNKPYKKFWVQSNIIFSGYVLTAKKDIYANTIITDDLIDQKKLQISSNNLVFFTDKNDLINNLAKNFIKKDDIFNNNNIGKSYLVSAGDIVKIIAKYQNITLYAIGKAFQTGDLNSKILVQNLDTKKVLTAKVINLKEVLVEF